MEMKSIQIKWQSRFSDVTHKMSDKHRPSYLHFDIKPNFKQATKKIFDPAYVTKHSFLPFIFFEAKMEKIKRLTPYVLEQGYDPSVVSKKKPYILKALRHELNKDTNVSRLLVSKKGREHKYSTHKLRPICYASHFDSMLYSYYGAIISNFYEKLLMDKGLDNEVLAFRPSKDNKKSNNITFANGAFKYIARNSPCVVLAFDVSSFFDILDHGILKRKWVEVMSYDKNTQNKHSLSPDHFAVFKSLTQYSRVEIDKVYKEFGINGSNPKGVSSALHNQMSLGLLPSTKRPVTRKTSKNRLERLRICSPEGFRKHVVPHIRLGNKDNPNKGIPQGSPLSGLLSNVYMIDFDLKAKQFAESLSGTYMRYCDDLLCIVPLKEKQAYQDIATKIQTFIFNLAKEFKLVVNDDKTDKYFFSKEMGSKLTCSRITESGLLKDRLQYLGFHFDGRHVSIRSSSIMRYKKKMKRGINFHLRLRDAYAPGEKLKTHKLRCDYDFNKGVDKSSKKISNFPSYARRADEAMQGSIIKRQLNNRSKELSKQIKIIEKRNAKRKQRRERLLINSDT